MFNFLRKQPDLSGMTADQGNALLDRINAPAPDKAKDGLSVSREDLQADIRRFDQAIFDNECAIGAAEITIEERKAANVDIAKDRARAVASIAVLDRAAADLDALATRVSDEPGPSTPAKPKRRPRKVESAQGGEVGAAA
jgi:hypothetical protein